MIVLYGEPTDCAVAASLLKTVDAAVAAGMVAKPDIPFKAGTDVHDATIDSLLDYINRMKKGEHDNEAD